MPVLRSMVDTASEAYQANRAGQLAAIAALDEQLELARAGGGPQYAQRHHDRGRLLARERIELLVDRDSPLLELSRWPPGAPSSRSGASIVTGHRRGVRRRVRADRPRPDRARRRDEPVHAAQEAAGAGDRPAQPAAGDQPGRVGRGRPAHPVRPVRGRGQDLPRPDRAVRRWASPTIALVFGNSTAGGAYVPGMCDYSVLVDEQAKVFLGGPPAGEDGHRRGRPTTSRWAAPTCTRGSPAWPTTSPSTSWTASGSAARSWPTCTGASSARRRA